MAAFYPSEVKDGMGIFRGFSPRQAWQKFSGTGRPGRRFRLMTTDRSYPVKDMVFPLAIFITLHAVFIGAALTMYVR
ncbi:MAG: hypothetical protein HC868_07700 [Sphingomonadales bacterium]|nr:hypothetical protein [Sphingomonadales bacterium]